MTDQISYDVKIWALKSRRHRSGKVSYRVRWSVAGREFGEPFQKFKLADNFRNDLIAATKAGEGFLVEKPGLPTSMIRKEATKLSAFQLACAYIDMKWPDASPKYRRSLASSLTGITVSMLRGQTAVDGKVLRKALTQAFNTTLRKEGLSPDVAAVLDEVGAGCRRADEFSNPDVLRSVLSGIDRNIDGSKAAPDTVRIRRVALRDLLDFAVEREVFDANPLEEIKVKKRSYEIQEVDPGVVVSPIQGRMLLEAVRDTHPELVAFFAAMYFAGLRPEEAADLKRSNLPLSLEGEGWLKLEGARPEVGGEWTDSGEASEAGPLKHRNVGATRQAPCTSELAALLHAHLVIFGTAPDGRLFRGVRDGGRLSSSVYGRAWATARAAVFTPEVAAGPLGKRPYDLRHAAVSTWLNNDVEATRVAKWAGHSLAVLLRVYAKCRAGGEVTALEKLERAYSMT
ncbi:hypothetical protein SAMN04489729_4263 [Amycolatopsis lurida]|uniref:Integrase n=1 Tax=Amycolatopsis lurida NRRL 2430 TaxID=1460371 RepID=A0A2P2FFJ5_AMYLU|nr:integrase [Amycolatopsis lurida]KFU75496.1 integrase [Amycolatopsis lurida NRRL 2430]SED40816.1 hypothetical protein SAMN04489729_4263 [Amycolatopsis lurida]